MCSRSCFPDMLIQQCNKKQYIVFPNDLYLTASQCLSCESTQHGTSTFHCVTSLLSGTSWFWSRCNAWHAQQDFSTTCCVILRSGMPGSDRTVRMNAVTTLTKCHQFKQLAMGLLNAWALLCSTPAASYRPQHVCQCTLMLQVCCSYAECRLQQGLESQKAFLACQVIPLIHATFFTQKLHETAKVDGYGSRHPTTSISRTRSLLDAPRNADTHDVRCISAVHELDSSIITSDLCEGCLTVAAQHSHCDCCLNRQVYQRVMCRVFHCVVISIAWL